ncbi:alpha-glucosidase [Niabella ginsenosidivorans]|uniref:Alpha-glucosidase n=1 Tax=Niabella ginsenosidivorans TaxID=1176587 RepID=A0A1A9I340_9BACT|nr:glycoside hydrolase family 97 protein [Niabella ginsenosidivorans]ANH82087.1 alpha-glucosidase [Niabella ginsenosidivorans]
MFRIKSVIVLLCLILGNKVSGSQTVQYTSPGGQIKLVVAVKDSVCFSVLLGREKVIDQACLGLQFGGEKLPDRWLLRSKKEKLVNEDIRPVIPLKFSHIQSVYRKVLLSFKNGVSIEFRLFDDGVAYRYLTGLKGEQEIMNEKLELSFNNAIQFHMQQPGSFKTAYEEPYVVKNIPAWLESKKMGLLPWLGVTKSGIKILMSETNLRDYPGMFFTAASANSIKAVFPKMPLEFGEDGDRSVKITREADYIAKTNGKRDYPWRYFLISKDEGAMLTNTMNAKLAGSGLLQDASWIQPGQASWEWWNGASPYGPDVNFESGFNLDTYKYFIDFASKKGVRYIVMDEGWAASTLDPFTPNPKVDLHQLLEYGKQKGVGIILWLTWLTVEKNFGLFKTFSDWGVKGVKIDFMDRSDQWMVNYYERVAKEAARYHLFVDFHGAFKPSGLEYLYPNVISYEGVRGMEQMGGATPDNSVYLPFIRNSVGPMDYTPGAMISMQPEVYSSKRPNSAAVGTRCYQMALFVVFESGIQMLADNPTQYYKNPDVTGFITSVPTTWDETRVLAAKLGEYVIVAKRKGDEWFIGGITNDSEKWKTFKIKLDFLNTDTPYKMDLFEDGINAPTQAMDYRATTKTVRQGDEFRIKIARNGGFAARIKK